MTDVFSDASLSTGEQGTYLDADVSGSEALAKSTVKSKQSPPVGEGAHNNHSLWAQRETQWTWNTDKITSTTTSELTPNNKFKILVTYTRTVQFLGQLVGGGGVRACA